MAHIVVGPSLACRILVDDLSFVNTYGHLSPEMQHVQAKKILNPEIDACERWCLWSGAKICLANDRTVPQYIIAGYAYDGRDIQPYLHYVTSA